MLRSAVISQCEQYRYLLTRTWDDGAPALPFVMLNPSVADADIDDPTIRRCIAFAMRDGFGGIMVANLYAYRSTDPSNLWLAPDPYGPDNDSALTKVAAYSYARCVPVVCAWGAQGGRSNRPIVLMQQAGATLVCLGKTKDGQPRHPLYVKGDQPLETYP